MKKGGRPSQVRIIGGRWRGSRIDVLDHEGLRPTPDRVRETLFNWLAPELRGARVLDCCAGSGVLGLEAASRGAGRVTLVEQERRAAATIETAVKRLDGPSIEVVHADVANYLQSTDERFDIVFIDPPYALSELRESILTLLIDRELLNDGAMLYLEWSTDEHEPAARPGLEWYRRKSAGQVAYAIAQWRDTR